MIGSINTITVAEQRLVQLEWTFITLLAGGREALAGLDKKNKFGLF